MTTSSFQVIIPMTGNGSRFVAAGFEDLKPFIQVQGKSMIEWIASSMFSVEDDITFICRAEHLKNRPQYRELLKQIVPNSRILEIETWDKKGPVFDVMKVAHEIDDTRPTVISYCDYFMLWDWSKFKKEVLLRKADGAIPCYSGFHPHLIPEKNLYASCRVDKNDDLIEIKEKFSFEADKFKARHSPGLYYFNSGELLKKYYQKTINTELSLNGEYYSSLPYNLLVKDGLKVWTPSNVDYFCQWGTPEDLGEYLFWTQLTKGFKK